VSTSLHEHATTWWKPASGSAERSLISAIALQPNWHPADRRAALAATAPAPDGTDG
jgi:hypothetical protein